MRLHPAVTQVGRTSAQDDILAGYHMPSNTHLLIGIHVIHRSQKYWTDPETFKPERFENLSKYFFSFHFSSATSGTVAAQMSKNTSSTCSSY